MKISILVKDGEKEVEADVDGCFAVHTDYLGHDDCEFPGDIGWTVTHIPSRYAFISGVSKEHAIECRATLLAGTINWEDVKRPGDLTDEHKRVGRSMRDKYERVS